MGGLTLALGGPPVVALLCVPLEAAAGSILAAASSGLAATVTAHVTTDLVGLVAAPLLAR
jgi:hypothetical protein